MSHVQQVVLVRERPNHLLHLILTLLTAGLWVPVWLMITMSSRFKRANVKPTLGFRFFAGVVAAGVLFALLF